MLVKQLAKSLLNNSLNVRLVMCGGSHKAYDWRDDPHVNKDFEQDSRTVGVKLATQLVSPHQAQPNKWFFAHPDNYNPKDLSQNLTRGPSVRQVNNLPELPQTDWVADIAHEYDYQSEDLDFQAQSFNTQHFRKKGNMWMWILAGTLPFTYFAGELFMQQWADQDVWRYQRPPAYNYPDDEDTPDDQSLAIFKSKQYQDLYDAGLVGAPFFKVVDGKKIYSKWAGVNEPMEPN